MNPSNSLLPPVNLLVAKKQQLVTKGQPMLDLQCSEVFVSKLRLMHFEYHSFNAD